MIILEVLGALVVLAIAFAIFLFGCLVMGGEVDKWGR